MQWTTWECRLGHRRFGHPRSATDYVRDAPAMRPSTQQPDQPENGGNAPRASESEVQILSPRLLRSAVNAVPSGFERWHWLPLGGRRACARADSEASPGGSSPHAFIGAAGSVERGESMLRFSRGCGPATSDLRRHPGAAGACRRADLVRRAPCVPSPGAQTRTRCLGARRRARAAISPGPRRSRWMGHPRRA